jgi:predicted TIM-barrel fold metal-dependent hydrolase
MTDTEGLRSSGGSRRTGCITDKKVIDIHVHMVGTGDTVKGCIASKEFLCSPTFSSMLMSLKTPPFALTDDKIREFILESVGNSESVDCSVLLALDGVYKHGRLVASETLLSVPNDYIISLSRTNKKVLFGASVHPYRETAEMLNETRRCIGEGAALFVWAPSGQQINPEDDRCIPFYVCLAREGVPLLCHAGAEFAMSAADSKTIRCNDPKRLKKALDIGVKVIVAHCAAPSRGSIMPFERGFFDELTEMLKVAEEKNWELYADISACCSPSKSWFLEKIIDEIEEGRISPKRFLYGSDFPMPAVDINIVKRPLNAVELVDHMRARGNLLDNHYRILKAFGLHESVFTNACDVLRM